MKKNTEDEPVVIITKKKIMIANQPGMSLTADPNVEYSPYSNTIMSGDARIAVRDQLWERGRIVASARDIERDTHRFPG